MNKVIIKRANFDRELSKIRDFARDLPKTPGFTTVATIKEGWIWDSDHQVTGKEMNRFIKEVQTQVTSTDKIFRAVIKEFEQVYQVFDALDKEYVAGIVGSVKEIEKISDVALELGKKNEQTIERLSKTVEHLFNLKEDFSEFKTSTRHNFEKLAGFIDKLSDFASHVGSDIAEIRQRQDAHGNLLAQLPKDMLELKTSHQIQLDELGRRVLVLDKVIEDIVRIQNDLAGFKKQHARMEQALELLVKKNDALADQIASIVAWQEKEKSQSPWRLTGVNILAASSLGLSLVNLFLYILKT